MKNLSIIFIFSLSLILSSSILFAQQGVLDDIDWTKVAPYVPPAPTGATGATGAQGPNTPQPSGPTGTTGASNGGGAWDWIGKRVDKVSEGVGKAVEKAGENFKEGMKAPSAEEMVAMRVAKNLLIIVLFGFATLGISIFLPKSLKYGGAPVITFTAITFFSWLASAWLFIWKGAVILILWFLLYPERGISSLLGRIIVALLGFGLLFFW